MVMVELTFLGRVSVRVDGVPITGEAAQRRRVALLALLADVPIRPVSRDRLMLYLWPDNDTESARHLLSSSLHVLRKALGPDSIRISGEQVELSADRVNVDVVSFEEAARAPDPERAVAVYGGPFLEGLVLPSSPEFEQWQELRRAELERLHAAVLEQLAEARVADGRIAEATDLWRRLTRLDPYSARPVLGLMQTLAVAGDRAAALQAARAHAERLATEFGARPDPEVQGLADQLRLEPSPAPVEPPAQPAFAAADSPSTATTTSVPAPEPITNGPTDSGAATSHGRRWWWAALLVPLVVAGVGVLNWVDDDPSTRVIAVIPRAGLGPDSATDYLSYGVAESIDYELGRSGSLRVVNSGSSFLYRDSVLDPRDMGRRLGAEVLVTVSGRMVNDTPSIRVELLRVRDGERLWRERYQGRQIEVASDDAHAAIARILGAARLARDRTGPRPTVTAEAFDLYQQGRFAWSRRTPASLTRAMALLERAVEIDPGYARAHVGLADVYNVLGSYDYGVLSPGFASARARDAAMRALALDPDLAAAHAALANVRMNYDWDWAAAESGFRRAIQLNPGYTPASEWLAYLLLATGRGIEAERLLLDALEYDQASALVLTNLAHFHYYAGEYDQAHRYLDRAMTADPEFERAYLLRLLLLTVSGLPGMAAAQLEPMVALRRSEDPVLASLLGYARALDGQTNAALDDALWLQDLRRTRFVPTEYEALIHVGLGDHDRALDLLEEAFHERSNTMVYLRIEPILDPLRGLERFQRLVDRVP
jgi:DNA-binding SARP family transcriptional activator/tetratricopeptide (TPR) repeat protein